MAGSGSNGGELALGCLFGVLQLATYVMAAIRWFSTEHNTFWFGFKELIWALCPIVNFTYVWDWWLAFFLFVFVLIKAAVEFVGQLGTGGEASK